MAHPYAGKAKTGQEMAKHRYADGGGIDESIDVSKPGPGQYPYSLGQKMSNARSEMDSDERARGERFFDSGTRIPGNMKAKNDAYRAKLKGD